MQLCAITDRRNLSVATATEDARRQRLLRLVESWAAGGVQFIQLREKDLPAPQLQSLARELIARIGHRPSKLLVNVSTPAAAALAVADGADGVHLAGKLVPGAAATVRSAFQSIGRNAIVSVPCHSLEDIRAALEEQVDLVLFSPVFEKGATVPQGLDALQRACAAAPGIPVLALGGVTVAHAPDCVAAGAAGVAGIRLFAGDDWRRLSPS